MDCHCCALAGLTFLKAIVVGNWLYIQGGEIHYNDNGVMTFLPSAPPRLSPFIISHLNLYSFSNIRN